MKAVLEILDETNCRFHGLDTATRNKMVASMKFLIPYARHLPQVKMGRWDGKVSFCTIGGFTYVNLLDKVLPIVLEAGYELEVQDRRKQYNFTFPTVTERYLVENLESSVWPEGHPEAGKEILLRDYQVDAINCYLDNLQSIGVLATGSGKCLGYDTVISLVLDERSTFRCGGNWAIGAFIEELSRVKSIPLQYGVEIPVDDLGIKVHTPTGLATVTHVIKKREKGLIITLEDGYVLRCAEKHILRQNGKDVFANMLSIGQTIDAQNGEAVIAAISSDGEQDYYDLSIPAPHLYYDAHGIIHHNTITTATLSHLVEPYGRSIVIVPSKSLVAQTEEDYKNLGLDVGVFFGDRKEYGKTHTISTWQSLSILSKKSKWPEDFPAPEVFLHDFLDGVVCVMVDECLDGNTPILTPEGYKPISTLKAGDKVINFDESGSFKEDEIVRVHHNLTNSQSEAMYELVMDTGEVLYVTGNHRFLTDRGWVRADELTTTDEIVQYRGE